ncbi:MAG: acyl-CoA dehydrogenase family protein [Chloroflexi bacterium]|nr:acyl-CoA dehydrogenase family protein [Chloroflexota bacterium]
MDFGFTPQEVAFRQEVRSFVARELHGGGEYLLDLEDETDASWRLAVETTKKLGERGWLTMGWPGEWGKGYTLTQKLVFEEEIAYHRVPIANRGGGSWDWVGPALVLYGTEVQRRELLPGIVRGETVFCTLYSEPNAGSDLASMTTAAVADGDDYVVNGQKIWTSGAHRSGWGWLAARTDFTAPKHKGISNFLVPMDAPGIRIRPLVNMADVHHFNEVFFENVRIPKRYLVGELNRGWYQTAVALDYERSTGIGYVASARRTLEELVDYARTTKVNGRALSQEPTVRARLADLALSIETGRMLAYRLNWLQSKGTQPNAEASMVKATSTELLQKAAAIGMQLLGLHGQLRPGSKAARLGGHIVQSHLAYVSMTIAAGTSEIQRNIIAQRGLGLPRA